MFEAYFEAINNYCKKYNKKIENCKILDLGCGRGEFLEFAVSRGLDIEGCDFDETCLKLSKKYANVFYMNINNEISLKNYDIILLSHVLEHIKCPPDFLKQIRKYSKAIIIGIPNPCRPNVVFNFCLRRHHYVNRGHYYSWDRSHFQNFLDLEKFKIISWHYDDFHFPNWFIVGLLRYLGLKIIEYKLRKILPYLSTSHIVLVEA